MKRTKGLLGVMLAAMMPTVALANTDEAWKQEMERKIDVLTQELEKNKLGAAAEKQEAVYSSKHGLSPAASKVYHVNRGVSLGGYGEFLLQSPSRERDNGDPSNRKRSLDAYRAILYAGYKFNDKILLNSEFEFEHATTGEGAEERGEVSVEFAYLDFLLSEPAAVRAGLVLVPMGFVNEMHEPTTFHGSRRPSVEQNIIPSTWRENGVGAFGHVGRLSYRTYVLAGLQGPEASNADGFSAGSAIRGGRTSGSESLIEDVAWVGRVDYEVMPGSLVGFSLYTGQSGQNSSRPSGETIDGRVTLWEGHTSAQYRALELKALYAQGTIGDVTALNEANGLTGSASIGERFFGGYAEAAYNALAHFQTRQYLAPFFRWERYDTQQRVPQGFAKNPANSRTEYVVGLTYKPIPQVVVKGDWQNVNNQANTGVNQVNFALGYIF